MTLPQELQAARLRLAKGRPYLASAVWALLPVAKPGIGTAAVDMYWRLYYDPDVLSRWPVESMEGVLYHEICHLLRSHPERMKGLNPHISNIAADAEINDDLIREKVKFPIVPVTPQLIGQPENLLAEEYYAALEKKERGSSSDQMQDADLDSPGEKENDGLSKFAADNDSSNTRDEDSSDSDPKKEISGEKSGIANQEDDKAESPRPGAGRCGSCATGQMAPWEDAPPGKGSSSGISQIEAELIRRDVANQIKEHMRSQGRVPGHWSRWAEEKLEPKVDWRKQLGAAVRYAFADTNGATDYSYRRPSRRQGQMEKGDVIFPSMRCPVPSVAIIADTSASISDKMLAQTLAEISGILKAMGRKEGIHVLAVDNAVQSISQVFRPQQVQLAGGGGTDMGVGLEAAAKLKPSPRLGIVITDGYTSWPETPPQGMKVIIVLTGDGKAPDWANVIEISASNKGQKCLWVQGNKWSNSGTVPPLP
ncbi:MAG TPA: VWA-like domain-containing protein [Syntrophomonadaceae bacterium]|nr:VWA-like domain-containing protein [Syntrophomonadaceae bacterium]